MRFDQLARITGGTLHNTDRGGQQFRGVSIDSRAVEPAQLFVALRGERNDGHDYIDAALESQAAGLLVQYDYPRLHQLRGDIPVVAVPNSHQAMIALAIDYRKKVNPRRIGISGSNGKTTTKEMIFHLLKALGVRVYRSPGNFNNLFGMPLALLAMPQDTDVAVLEMGISVPGEMSRLAEIVRPDVMVITNVGASHLQFLGTVEGVAREKLKALNLMSLDQPLIINADDRILVAEARKLRTDHISYGIDEKATYQASGILVTEEGHTVVQIGEHSFRLSSFGHYQAYNLLAAYATVTTMGYDFDGIDTESLVLPTTPMRGEIVTINGVTFVVDCYNANPDSARSGLISFGERKHDGRRLLVMGDMLELGADSESYHREVGRQISTMSVGLVALVGPMSRFTADELVKTGMNPRKVERFDHAVSCADRMGEVLTKDDLVYLKASRGIGLEVILQRWIDEKGNA